MTRRKASLQQHEWRILATLPLAVGMIGWLIWSLVAAPADQRKQVRSGPIAMQTSVPAMAQPTLDAAEPLPSREQLAAQAEPLSALAEHPGTLALVGTDLDGLTLAWGLRQLAGDRLALPIPGRPTATDLVDREIRQGSPVVVEGRLVDARREAIPAEAAAAPGEQPATTVAETPAELDADKAFLARLESMRLEAGRLMGLGDVSGKVVPKVGLLSKPGKDGSIRSRYFTPLVCHKAHAVTGAVCVASACALPGTVARNLVRPGDFSTGVVRIEHPSGAIEVDLQVTGQGDAMDVTRAALLRTARRIFEGNVLVPERHFSS